MIMAPCTSKLYYILYINNFALHIFFTPTINQLTLSRNISLFLMDLSHEFIVEKNKNLYFLFLP